MSNQKNWQVDHNTTFEFRVEYKNEAGAAIDLTGATAKLQVRDTTNSARLAFTLSSPASGIVINEAAGTITVKMSPAQTSKLFYPKAIYDLVLTDSNSNRIKMVEGWITLNKTVTV